MLNFLELKQKLGLPEDRKLFSFNELIKQPALMDMLDEAQKLRQAGKGDDLTALQKEAEHSGERLRLFQDLVQRRRRDGRAESRFGRRTLVPIQTSRHDGSGARLRD